MRLAPRSVRPLAALSLGALLSAVAGCGGDGPSAPGKPVADHIVVGKSALDLGQKTSQQITASVVDKSGAPIAGAPLAFASSNQSVARVDAAGLVTSLGPVGTTTVTVSSGDLHQAVAVSVHQVATSIQLPGTVNLLANGSARLAPVVLDAVGQVMSGGTVTFTSADADVVSVSSDGTLHAGTSLGAADVTAHAGELSTVVHVNVISPSHPEGVLDGTVTVAGGVWSLDVSNAGTLFVGGTDGGVSRAELTRRAFSEVLAGNHASAVGGIAFDRAGTTAYVSGRGNQLVALDVATNATLWSATLPLSAYAVALSADEGTVYVSTANGAVHAISTATHAEVAAIGVGGVITFMTVAPDGRHMYVNDEDDGVVNEIDLQTNTVSRHITIAPGYSGVAVVEDIAVSHDGTELYVADEGNGGGRVIVVDVATGNTIATVAPTPTEPGAANVWDLALTPDGTQIYAAMPNRVVIIDRATRTIVKYVQLSGVVATRVVFDAPGTTAVVAYDQTGVAFIR